MRARSAFRVASSAFASSAASHSRATPASSSSTSLEFFVEIILRFDKAFAESWRRHRLRRALREVRRAIRSARRPLRGVRAELAALWSPLFASPAATADIRFARLDHAACGTHHSTAMNDRARDCVLLHSREQNYRGAASSLACETALRAKPDRSSASAASRKMRNSRFRAGAAESCRTTSRNASRRPGPCSSSNWVRDGLRLGFRHTHASSLAAGCWPSNQLRFANRWAERTAAGRNS